MLPDYDGETIQVPASAYGAIAQECRTSAWTVEGQRILNMTYAHVPEKGKLPDRYVLTIGVGDKTKQVKISKDEMIIVCARDGEMIVNKAINPREHMAELLPAKLHSPRMLKQGKDFRLIEEPVNPPSFIASPETADAIERAIDEYLATGNRDQSSFKVVDFADAGSVDQYGYPTMPPMRPASPLPADNPMSELYRSGVVDRVAAHKLLAGSYSYDYPLIGDGVVIRVDFVAQKAIDILGQDEAWRYSEIVYFQDGEQAVKASADLEAIGWRARRKLARVSKAGDGMGQEPGGE